MAPRPLVHPQPQVFHLPLKSRFRRTRKELFPVLSRMQNIGYELGENGRTPEWYQANHRTPWVAEDNVASGTNSSWLVR